MRDLSVKFLRAIWAKQLGGTGFLAFKDWEGGGREGDFSTQPVQPPSTFRPKTLSDLYFAPCLFSADRRQRQDVMPSCWLYADLDEVNPRTARPRPTVAWQTSPNRYQCMWLIDRPLRTSRFERLNRALTYYVGADKGGWSVTKVLRVPGSINNKYSRPFKVRLLWSSSQTYNVLDLETLLKDVSDDSRSSSSTSLIRPPRSMSASRVLHKHRQRLPLRTRRLLSTRTLVKGDDRSARLWELENSLLDCGLDEREVYVLVKETVWNKYRGQQREQRMLSDEIHRASRRPHPPPATPPSPAKPRKRRSRFTPVRVADLLTTTYAKPAWLVKGIWSEAAHGLLAGEEKTFKSLLTMDLAVSVATGTPFLGHFEAPVKGPVLIIQEENDPGLVQDRMHRILNKRHMAPNLDGSTLDFKGADPNVIMVNQQGFKLNDPEHMRWLDRYMSKIRPALVVFDPLYLMTPDLDESDSTHMTPILSNLLELKIKHRAGTMIVHHFHKATQDRRRLSQRMSGTGVFGRWYASAVYVESLSDEDGRIRVSTQHRGQGPHYGYEITFDLGEEGDSDTYDVTIDTGAGRAARTPPTDLTIAQTIEQAGKARASLRSLATATGLSTDAVRKRAQREGLTLKTLKTRQGTRRLFVYAKES